MSAVTTSIPIPLGERVRITPSHYWGPCSRIDDYGLK
jgi:hypothetical protein